MTNFNKIFTQDYLDSLLPKKTSDMFFEALYGDASEGAYDISLLFIKTKNKKLFFEFNLKQRKNKCLACNLTYGLPEVFTRHPLININGMITKIKEKGIKVKDWSLGATYEKSSSLHTIPLILTIE